MQFRGIFTQDGWPNLKYMEKPVMIHQQFPTIPDCPPYLLNATLEPSSPKGKLDTPTDVVREIMAGAVPCNHFAVCRS
jgi:hypothetical protein